MKDGIGTVRGGGVNASLTLLAQESRVPSAAGMILPPGADRGP